MSVNTWQTPNTWIAGVHTGSGELASGPAEIIGNASRVVVGTGSLVSQLATINGLGSRIIVGIGGLAPSTSTVGGSGNRVMMGSGQLVPTTAFLIGEGIRLVPVPAVRRAQVPLNNRIAMTAILQSRRAQAEV